MSLRDPVDQELEDLRAENKRLKKASGTTWAWCEKGSTAGLSEAIEELYSQLPGWWFSVGNCHVTADATVGPDANGPDAWLLQFKEFDDGIESNLPHPATVATALLSAIELALAAKIKREQSDKPKQVEIAEWIAGDSSCARGGFKDRVLATLPYITPLVDELKALKQAQEWRPIATAPHSKLILCAVPSLPYPKILFWADYADQWRAPENEGRAYEPTHWMPLPAAPEQIGRY